MKFEKLNDNKIKIILTIKDLEEKNIDFHSFMANSIESQNLFIDILNKAEQEIGFVTSNYNIHIEAFATSDGIFIFTVTRANVINLPKNKKLIYKRKLPKSDSKLAIYKFNSFDDYCNFCNFLSAMSIHYLGTSSLILYNSKYYLILDNIKMDFIHSKHFFTYVSEFANLCDTSKLFANILFEYGENLIPENAIGIGIRYFR